MASLANALKEEIATLTRREIRRQSAPADKAMARFERDIDALQREVQELQHGLASLPTSPRGPTAAAGKTSGDASPGRKSASAASSPSASAKQPSTSRFTGEALKAHRNRVGLSVDNYGKLVGVSGLSIYNWEHGKARPRKSSVKALMAIRRIGKREAARRLAALETPETQP